MKCKCKNCQGSGQVDCNQCDGTGVSEDSIEKAVLNKNMENYDELKELQADARRVIGQATELSKINPGRAGAYADQLKGCLFIINGQVERVMKPRKVQP